MKKFSCFILFTSIILTGCSSSPPQVKASTPLIDSVASSINTSSIPKSLWADLSSKSNGTIVRHQQFEVEFGYAYFSALGQKCRQLYISSISSDVITPKQKRIACLKKNDLSWWLMPQVVDNQGDNYHFDAL
ncbi:hypothetical protein [Shewanella sp. TC10]|uniref:hypothetical protein n=1 Tax=Shewanella sp. TC10 TaxID=1419739 RepID=UPI00129E61A7|nr:hypothetical protein [Shewanella sp. TC10]